MKRSVVNDDSKITSNLTMYTRMTDVENNIGSLDNSVNHISCMLQSFIKETSQGSNQSPANFVANNQNNNDSAKVVENNILDGPHI